MAKKQRRDPVREARWREVLARQGLGACGRVLGRGPGAGDGRDVAERAGDGSPVAFRRDRGV
jgi:hypothetical protein